MEQSSEPQGGGRTYRKPELRVLGDLAELTKTVGVHGVDDGGFYYGPLKTH